MIPDKMLAYFSKFLFQICSRVGKTELLEVKRKWKKHIFPTFLQWIAYVILLICKHSSNSQILYPVVKVQWIYQWAVWGIIFS